MNRRNKTRTLRGPVRCPSVRPRGRTGLWKKDTNETTKAWPCVHELYDHHGRKE
jgi:hypothetical protein